MAVAEAEFERELAAFDTDVNLATQYFYALQATHYLASQDEQLLKAMNWNALYWNTSLGAMQVATFAALGRIFDKDPRSHSVHRLLRLAASNPDLFSLGALRRRKRGDAEEDPDWLEEYMRDRYCPDASDWARLAKALDKWASVFADRYQPLRHKVYAHRDRLDKLDLEQMFAATNYRETEKLLAFLTSLLWALRDLYDNGRKPVLKPQRYSLVEMIKHPRSAKSGGVAQMTVHDTQQTLARIPNVKRRPTSAST